MTSIFQIDWISVDIIIIILLLLLLFSVKMFKITHRWRYSFSNQALEHICFSQAREKSKNQIFLTKKWCLTRNSSLKENFSNLPLILIFRTNYKRKLLRVFTEGLSSYGFNVINIKAKINHIPDSRTLEKTLIDEWNSLISAIFDDFKLTEVMIKSKYILISHSKSIISYKQILSGSDSKGAILINPKLNKKISSDYYNIFKNNSINGQIYTIFSRKSTFIFKNKHLIKFLKEITPQKNNILKHLTIEKATYSFKYYETIVLGMIIDIIENKLLKSKI